MSLINLKVELQKANKRIAELDKKLKPRLFWESSNLDTSHDCIEKLMQLKFENGASVGDEVEIEMATTLTNQTYIFTKIDNENYEYEYKLKEGNS